MNGTDIDGQMPTTNPARFIAAIFARSGCIRVPAADRRRNEGQAYKKGYEIRLSLMSKSELTTVRRCLLVTGFKPARAYAKHSRIVQVIYGRASLEAFVRLVRSTGVLTEKIAKFTD